MYSPSKMAMAGMGLASAKAASRPSSAAQTRSGSAVPAGTDIGGSAAAMRWLAAAGDSAERSPTPGRRQSQHREPAVRLLWFLNRVAEVRPQSLPTHFL